MRLKLLPLGLLCLCSAVPSFAGSQSAPDDHDSHDHDDHEAHDHDAHDHDDEHQDHESDEAHRAHEAHVHGEAQLFAALDGENLVIEVTSPGYNIFGFETAPANEDETKIIADALAQLEDGANLFAFSQRAKCAFTKFSYAAPWLEADAVAVEHDEDEHDHEHAEKDHAAHHDGDDHEGEDHDAHDEGGHRTNLVARYAFECERPEPFRLETTLFEQFERLEKIEATFLSDTVQGFHVLTPDETSAVYE